MEKEYDFIWHQEDDLIISEHIKIDDLITYFNENKNKHHIRLPYQLDWYAPAEETGISMDDLPLEEYKNYHIVNAFHFAGSSNFDTSFSLTRANILFGALDAWKEGKLNWVNRLGAMYKKRGYSEATLYHVMAAYNSFLRGDGNKSFLYDWGTAFYDMNKNAFVEHVGEWSWGQRLTPELFKDKLKELEETLPGVIIWVIGGPKIIEQSLGVIDEFFLSRIPGAYACDTFLPLKKIESLFNKTWSESHNEVEFQIWKKRKVNEAVS